MWSILSLVVVAAAGYITHIGYGYYTNYRIAKSIGFPIIWSPFYPHGLIWQIFYGSLSMFLRKLPDSLTAWAKEIEPTWHWETNGVVHRDVGETFSIVSSGGVILYTADPTSLNSILSNRKDFGKPAIYENLELFGPNVDTVNGDAWTRHRKITAPCFNERVSGFVWDEALRQTRSMLGLWLSQPNGRVGSMVEDTRVIALHVLTAAGFGISNDFLGGARNVAPGHNLSYRDALMTVLEHFVLSIVLTQMPWLKKLGTFLPEEWQKVILAMKEFRRYMDEMLDAERKAQAQSDGTTKPNLISQLIRTSDEAIKESGKTSAPRLSDEEIRGNIFIFNIAGHDTTANTLAYAFGLLAVHPEIQDWIAEEVDFVLGELNDELQYEVVFPRLKRILALMYETLRLYGPVPHQPRGVMNDNTILQATSPTNPSETITKLLPKSVHLTMVVHAAHMNPRIFPDPTTFRPSRWLKPAGKLGSEEMVPPPPGYYPWSGGPRVCPGQKFAQVEFVAVIARVIRSVRVKGCIKDVTPELLEKLGGEQSEAYDKLAREEVFRVVRNTGGGNATLSLLNPSDLWIRAEKR
ncbi:cytochrome P450 [Dendryphion nanum]|uniref:Cytochrome P450 n=1 Tax=Dendryphion nanum TaxID=256645 RepID=A0A9P9DH69_9PLEO|nr:cytochrome P450 [Dendryphion nanum]